MSSEQCHEPDKASVIRAAIDSAIAWLGYKRGVYAAAQAIGIHERVAKGIRYGEAFAATDDRFERALELRRTLARERAARLRAELAELERIANDETVEASRGGGVHQGERVAA